MELANFKDKKKAIKTPKMASMCDARLPIISPPNPIIMAAINGERGIKSKKN